MFSFYCKCSVPEEPFTLGDTTAEKINDITMKNQRTVPENEIIKTKISSLSL